MQRTFAIVSKITVLRYLFSVPEWPGTTNLWERAALTARALFTIRFPPMRFFFFCLLYKPGGQESGECTK